jgi:hypothetical protein
VKIPYLEKPLSPGFKQIFPEAENVLKPLIPIVVRYREKKEKVFALVDSGADACLFPAGVAERLGIDVRAGARHDFVGISASRTPFFFHEVEILFGKYQQKTKVGFSASQNIGAGGILGQQGFFNHFVISFDHKNKFLEIKKPTWITELSSKSPF